MKETLIDMHPHLPSWLGRGLLKAVARPLGWVAFFSFFLNLSYLAAPLYMMQVYDRVMHSQSVPTLLYLTLAVAMAYAVPSRCSMRVRGQILAGVSDVIEETAGRAVCCTSATAPAAARARPVRGRANIGRDLDTVRQFASGAAVLAFIDLPWAGLYLGGAVPAALGAGRVRHRRGCGSAGPEPRGGAGGAHADGAGRCGLPGAPTSSATRSRAHPDCASTMGLDDARWRRSLARAGGRGMLQRAEPDASRRAVALGAAARFIRMLTQSAILGVGAWLAINHDITGGAMFAGSLLLGPLPGADRGS